MRFNQIHTKQKLKTVIHRRLLKQSEQHNYICRILLKDLKRYYILDRTIEIDVQHWLKVIQNLSICDVSIDKTKVNLILHRWPAVQAIHNDHIHVKCDTITSTRSFTLYSAVIGKNVHSFQFKYWPFTNNNDEHVHFIKSPRSQHTIFKWGTHSTHKISNIITNNVLGFSDTM